MIGTPLVVGNQKPLKGPSELMLYNNFCLGLNTNLLEVCATWSGIHVTSESTQKGLNIVSKKSDNCVSNTFSKILEKKKEGHSQVYNLFYLMGHFSCVMVLPELFKENQEIHQCQ